ncbi:MAG: Cys-tRNA(Pro) deacylase [Victivallaceae bacterium]
MNHAKTNALRLLEAEAITFAPFEYDVSDDRIDAVSVAEKLGAPPEQVFKTLVTVSPDKEYFVFIIPGDAELDLKKAARAAGKKSIEMIKAKELLPLTGYVHGGCSPVGMKKLLPTRIDETAILFERIFVSGGRIGLNLAISPEDLAGFINAEFADLAK